MDVDVMETMQVELECAEGGRRSRYGRMWWQCERNAIVDLTPECKWIKNKV